MPYWKVLYLPNFHKGPYVLWVLHHMYGDGMSFYSLFKSCSDGVEVKERTIKEKLLVELGKLKSSIKGLIAYPTTFIFAATLPQIKTGVFSIKNPRRNYNQGIDIFRYSGVAEML